MLILILFVDHYSLGNRNNSKGHNKKVVKDRTKPEDIINAAKENQRLCADNMKLK